MRRLARLAGCLLVAAATLASPRLLADQTPVNFPLPAGLASAWAHEQGEGDLSYNTKVWIGTLLKGELTDAAHNWATISPDLPGRLAPLADATYLTLAVQQGLYQTCVSHLIGDLGRQAFVSSPAWAALEPSLSPRLPQILADGAVSVAPQLRPALDRLPWTGAAIDLKAFAALRGGAAAADALTHVAADRPWRYRLALSAALSLARAGKLGDAIKLLEPLATTEATATGRNAIALALGRLYYQMADLKSAEAWYLKIPETAPEIVDAREELLWVWLRTGDVSRLRGTVVSLGLPEFRREFQPETPVVRGISDLKLCNYVGAKTDFNEFLERNGKWAKDIDGALKADVPPAPPNGDWYLRFLDQAITLRTAETSRIKELSKQSIAASVPAVGKQQHWEDAQKDLTGEVGRLTQLRLAEYRRQWRNDASLLQEAIRKMQFVKVELMSQLSDGATARRDTPAAASAAKDAQDAIAKAADTGWTFPVETTPWPDEVFALRSTASSVCL